ncbi:MAG: hypothetical protein NC093_04620 [Alistipes sp.]|nr:hypothetical protein [Alistipes sp.]
MRRKLTAAVLGLMLASFAGCGEKKQESSVSEADNTPVSESAADSREELSESDLSAAEDTEADTTDAPERSTVSPTEAVTEDTNISEASPSAGELSDSEIFEIAESLYASACETEWSFTVGAPFAIDTGIYVENGIGWQFFLVTDEGVNSMADVYREYHRVFAEEYADHLDELFIEENGRVYCLNGARGSDIFYSRSELTAIREKSADRVVMTVTDHYDGTDMGGEPYDLDRDFVMVNSGDGWRAAEFTLPY